MGDTHGPGSAMGGKPRADQGPGSVADELAELNFKKT